MKGGSFTLPMPIGNAQQNVGAHAPPPLGAWHNTLGQAQMSAAQQKPRAPMRWDDDGMPEYLESLAERLTHSADYYDPTLVENVKQGAKAARKYRKLHSMAEDDNRELRARVRALERRLRARPLRLAEVRSGLLRSRWRGALRQAGEWLGFSASLALCVTAIAAIAQMVK